MTPQAMTERSQDEGAGAVRRHWRALEGQEAGSSTATGMPAKAGMKKDSPRTSGVASDRLAEAHTGEAEMVGERAVFMLAKKGERARELPVFAAGAEEGAEALAVFTSRELATLYLQVARWDDHEVRIVAPPQLSRWLQQARTDGIRFIMVDPNRLDQVRGKQQALLPLDRLHDLSGENLYQEIRSIGQG
jgi:hypothetical protein